MVNETKSAPPPTILCAERRHLEAEVTACLGKLSGDSLEASKLARSINPDPTVFDLLRSESEADRVRLKTLRECLDFHRGWHGC